MRKLLSFNAGNRAEKGKSVNAPRMIVLSFAAVIVVGALLLMLPISSKSGGFTDPLTALFTATSATCVTGLVLRDTGSYFSYFGQAVILLMIQIGGLGFMSVLTLAFVAARRSISMRNRMIIAQSMGMPEPGGGVRLMLSIIKYTAATECAGAVMLAFRFVPEYGLKGVWYSVFHSVSAFCNAGFDVFGNGTSLMPYSDNPYVLCVIAVLIILGGFGYVVVGDVLHYARGRIKRLHIYTRLVFIISAVLIFSGTVILLVTERYNPAFGNSGGERLLTAFFQSVTTRTAGFNSVAQDTLSDSGKLVSVILMMIGGASCSTAGGVKVVTIGVVVIVMFKVLTGQKSFVIFGRQIDNRTVLYAMSLIALWLILIMVGGIFLSTVNGVPMIDSIYELTSAYGTVGLTCGVTAKLTAVTKIQFILYMFFGRVGVMTLCMMFMTRSKTQAKLKYPSVNLLIG